MAIKKFISIIMIMILSLTIVFANQTTISNQNNQEKVKSSYITTYYYNVNGCLEKNTQVINEVQPKVTNMYVIQKTPKVNTCYIEPKKFNMPKLSVPKTYQNQYQTYKYNCYNN